MAKSKQTAIGNDTREALILAGERLIAERGIDGVSLRQINTEAGQRNSSAAHYHFGSKDALIRSIYEYRLDSVNRRRQSAFDDLCTNERQNDIRGLAAIFIQPIVDEIQSSAGGSFYIRFLAQAIGHPQANARKYAGSILTDAAKTAYDHMTDVLPDVPEPIFGQRFGLMWEMIIHSLADRERYGESHTGKNIPDLFVANLIDTVAGGLSAPVSAGIAAASTRT